MKEETTIANYYKSNCGIQLINPMSMFVIDVNSSIYEDMLESEKRYIRLVYKLKRSVITKNKIIVSILMFAEVVAVFFLVCLSIYLLPIPQNAFLSGMLGAFLIIWLYYKLTTDIFICNYEFVSLIKAKHRNKKY